MIKTLGGGGRSSLIGSNEHSLVVENAPVRSELKLTPVGRSANLFKAATGSLRVYLNAEGVRGSDPSGVLIVALSRPDSDVSGVKTMAFFGLANATAVDGPHGGSGLTGVVEVTDLVHELGVYDTEGLRGLDVEISQPGEGRAPITVDRLSLYAKPG